MKEDKINNKKDDYKKIVIKFKNKDGKNKILEILVDKEDKAELTR